MDFNSLRTFLQTLEDEGEIFRVKLYINNDLLYSAEGSLFSGLNEADGSEWYAHKGENVLYFSPPQYLENDNIVSLVRNVVNPSRYTERIGVMRIDMEKKTLTDILSKANPTNHAVSYLINSDGCIVASSDDSLLEKYGLTERTGEELGYGGDNSESGLLTLKRGGSTFYYLKRNMEYTDWSMVTLIPEDDFLEVINHLRYLVCVLVVALGAFSCLVGGVLISGVVKRIKRLSL